MLEAVNIISSGIVFGLTFGLSPSPPMTLAIRQTLNYNFREGLKVTFAPLLTDIPISLSSILIISKLPSKDIFLGITFILGALFLTRIGVKSIKTKSVKIEHGEGKEQAHSFRQGILACLLNPNAYIFWFTIASVAVVEAWNLSPIVAVLYLAGFYTFLIGSRSGIAFLFACTKVFKNPRGYLIAMRILGIALICFAVSYAWQGSRILFEMLS